MRNERGITLIALVVTIIILILLAGITLNQIVQNGIINKVENAKELQEMKSDEEKIKLIIYDYIQEKAMQGKDVNIGNLNKEEMQEFGHYFTENGCEYVQLENKESEESEEGSNILLYVKVKKTSKYTFVLNNNMEILDIVEDNGELGKPVPEGWIGIYNEQDLIDISKDLTANYIVMANIKLTKEWTPIGDGKDPFEGQLDGDNHKITGLTNGESTADYQGLFGFIDSGSKISNISVEGTISGKSNIGLLVGYNNGGTIENVYSKGEVTGSSDYVGGLVGYNNGGTIENAYSTGEITGDSRVGGLVGGNYNSGTIKRSVSTGKVTGSYTVGGLVGGHKSGTIENAYSTGEVTGSSDYVGGLVGYNDSGTITNTYTISKVTGKSSVGGLVGGNRPGTITNSYWTPEKAGVRTSAGGIETTITWLITKANLEEKFDFEEIWGIEDGKSLPYLNGLVIPEEIYVKEIGKQVPEGWIGIYNEQDLIDISKDLTANYIVMSNIKLTKNWTPIGDSKNPFKGQLDGDNHKITGLTNGESTESYQGLFGYTGSGSKISNISIEGTISGKSNIGLLVGYNNGGTIENVYSKEEVTGSSDYVGGLVGYNNGGTIENAYSTGEVTGDSRVGGLVGGNYNSGTIKRSVSTGKVTGSSLVGGLVGGNDSRETIENAYSTGEVTGSSNYVGGLVGYNYSGTITNSYTISKVTGSSGYVGGLVGRNSGTITNSYWTPEKAEVETSAGGTSLTLSEMKTQESYIGWDFSTIWTMKEYPELIFTE